RSSILNQCGLPRFTAAPQIMAYLLLRDTNDWRNFNLLQAFEVQCGYALAPLQHGFPSMLHAKSLQKSLYTNIRINGGVCTASFMQKTSPSPAITAPLSTSVRLLRARMHSAAGMAQRV